ncbi:glycosyltransferase [Stieleria varia]|uniref:Glycosyl transferases group 1 n=1 Tax=Stieleria varia TaxID=2528005 RepID=A0A5C6AZ48_9BACT|nr:glycosyltransferase [Stieleria varia]TWU04402.1 Glycosyl transferases group 1 [Stieleria varia]
MSSVIAAQPIQLSERDLEVLRVAVYLADQNPHRDRSLGITSMTESLLGEMAKRNDLLMTQITSRSSHHQRESRFRTIRLPFRTDHSLGRLIADSVHPWIARPDVDVWYYPKGYVPRFAVARLPSVGTMHDTIVQHYADHYPETRTAGAFRYWINVTKRSLTRLDCVLTISNHAANQLRDFCDRHRLPQPKIEVTYEGSVWETLRLKDFQKEDFVVHLASTSPHKKTNRLLEMWRTLQQRSGSLPPLKLVGELDVAGRSILAELQHVELLPRQTLPQLQSWVGRARVLLMPSEIEGFGLPAVEAYYVGTSVCYVRGTSVDEILPSVGRFGAFDLADVDSLDQALKNALDVDQATIVSIRDELFSRYSLSRVSQRIVQSLRDHVV